MAATRKQTNAAISTITGIAVLLTLFIIWKLAIQSDPEDNISAAASSPPRNLASDKTESNDRQTDISSTQGHTALFTSSDISFLFNESKKRFYLQTKNIKRKTIIMKICEGVGYKLDTDQQAEKFLSQEVSLRKSGDFEKILEAVLGNLSFRYVQFNETIEGDSPDNTMTLCVGSYSCREFQSRPVIYADNSVSIEEATEPSGEYKKALKIDTSPGAESPPDYKSRSEILQNEFTHAPPEIKIRILKALDKHLDEKFIIDALVFEENSNVRQSAASALFPPYTDESRIALLDALASTDEMLILAIARLMEYSPSNELRYQAANILKNNDNPAIQDLARRVEIGSIPKLDGNTALN